MTAAFLTAPWDSLEQECQKHFDCEAVAEGFNDNSGGRIGRRRDKRVRISKTFERFRKVMAGPNPPRTKQEAVRAVGGIGALLLSYLFRQLAVMVAEWLWDRLQAEEGSFTVTMKEAR